MSKPAAPSMPTEHQVKVMHKAVTELCPAARIKRVGPNGVEFDYPSDSAPPQPSDDTLFLGEAT